MQSFTEEAVALDPELEEALKSATDTELCDLAGWFENPFPLRSATMPDDAHSQSQLSVM